MSTIANLWACSGFIMLVNIFVVLRSIRSELRKQGKK